MSDRHLSELLKLLKSLFTISIVKAIYINEGLKVFDTI